MAPFRSTKAAVKLHTLLDLRGNIIKQRLNLKASLYEMLQILSLTLFEKTHLLQLFSDIPAQTSLSDTDNQLNLFN